MSQVVTPTWSQGVSVIASTTLAKGSTVRGTLDLTASSGKKAAVLFVRIGRGGTTAIGTAIRVLIRRLANGSAGYHPTAHQLESSTAAANSSTASGTNSTGQAVLNLTSGTGFAGDDLCVADPAGAAEQWFRLSKVVTNALTLDANLAVALSSSQNVRNKADIFAPYYVPGGAVWEVIVDYGLAATGDSAQVEVLAQTYNSDLIT